MKPVISPLCNVLVHIAEQSPENKARVLEILGNLKRNCTSETKEKAEAKRSA